ncbi:MAG: hypothetical protein AAF485_03245 [Chloroflexota bacterium]
MREQIIENPRNLNFIQSRAKTNYNLVDEYAEIMRAGVQFDPAQGIRDEDDQVWVFDGLHRGEAAKMAGVQLAVDIQSGTKEDAEWLALTVNQKHGLRRSQADKRRIVRLALKHPNGVSLSNREIARHCGVSDKTVGKIRSELEVTAEIPQLDKRVVTKSDGRTYEINTRNIGRSATPEAEQKTSDVVPATSYHQTQKRVSTSHPLNSALIDNQVVSVPNEGDIETVPVDLPITLETNGYTLERQPHPCPRCHQDRIVGVNGSKRWCLHCEAAWETADDFLTELTNPTDAPALRNSVQQRFLELVSRLDNSQLDQVDTWLDDLERTLPDPDTIVSLTNDPA